MAAGYSVMVAVIFLAISAQAGSDTSVAVVGAGPHGLVAALELKQLGYNVTVFERETVILPIVESLQIDSIVYEYLGQALLPAANTNGSGHHPRYLILPRSMGSPWSHYQQPSLHCLSTQSPA